MAQSFASTRRVFHGTSLNTFYFLIRLSTPPPSIVCALEHSNWIRKDICTCSWFWSRIVLTHEDTNVSLNKLVIINNWFISTIITTHILFWGHSWQSSAIVFHCCYCCFTFGTTPSLENLICGSFVPNSCSFICVKYIFPLNTTLPKNGYKILYSNLINPVLLINKSCRYGGDYVHRRRRQRSTK